MIEPFIRALHQAGVQADDRELAEILWLSRLVSGPVTATPSQIPGIEPEQPLASIPSFIQPPGPERPAEGPIPPPTADLTPVYPVSLTDAGSPPGAGRKVRVSGAAALPAALDIARALRPFSRRFPSRQRLVFDEAATVRNAAEGGPLTPIRRPVLERWFEVALVVEDTPSMAVWQQTIAELQRLLASHGAFRDVHRWRFRTTEATIQLLSRAGVTHNVQQLKDPGGRRLILVVSDCVSPGWRDGAMAAVVARWGASMSVAIVQMLPETLWHHTALGSYSVSLRAVLPGVPNKHLAVTRPWWDIERLKGSVPVPVVTLEPETVSVWAGMVMASGVSFSGVLLGSSAPSEPGEGSRPRVEKPLEPKERVQLFRDLVSREAFRLAVYLAAVPLTLPVMRLVQRTMFMLPAYRQVHLAEVFLGGLLERVTPADVQCNADEVEYDFYEGVRDILTKSILRSEANQVLAAVSRYIEDHTGQPFDFEALMPDREGEAHLPAFALPFARVGAEFIKRLGRPPRFVKRHGTGEHPLTDQPISFRDRFVDSDVGGPEMVWLPGGTFTMGDDKSDQSDEKPAHRVTLSPFSVGKYPVTFEEYDAFCEATGREKPKDEGWGRGRRPVINISWDEAQEYCRWLSRQTGQAYRLLSEAQWEYACRAGSEAAYCFGDDAGRLGEYAWYWGNAGRTTYPVGGKQPNTWGLHDLHGNVWEWVQDWYGAYSEDAQHDPSGPASGSYRVIRGGGWGGDAGDCRSAFRSYAGPGDRGSDLGFRLARLGPLPFYPFTPPQTPTPGLRDMFKEGSAGPAMVWLPGGTFQMGDDTGWDREKPAHDVTVDAFSIGRYPVTFEDYDKFCEATRRKKPDDQGWGRGTRPVIHISWSDATAYCEWLSKQTGARYRLLTEAEWEYACRAESNARYCFGDDEQHLEAYAWYSKNAGDRTHPVGEKRPNAWHLYDMHGNVREWVQDWHGDYSREPQSNPSGPETGSRRVIRGGGWNNGAVNCRSAYRNHADPGYRGYALGFRLARDGAWPSYSFTLAARPRAEQSVQAESEVKQAQRYEHYQGDKAGSETVPLSFSRLRLQEDPFLALPALLRWIRDKRWFMEKNEQITAVEKADGVVLAAGPDPIVYGLVVIFRLAADPERQVLARQKRYFVPVILSSFPIADGPTEDTVRLKLTDGTLYLLLAEHSILFQQLWFRNLVLEVVLITERGGRIRFQQPKAFLPSSEPLPQWLDRAQPFARFGSNVLTLVESGGAKWISKTYKDLRGPSGVPDRIWLPNYEAMRYRALARAGYANIPRLHGVVFYEDPQGTEAPLGMVMDVVEKEGEIGEIFWNTLDRYINAWSAGRAVQDKDFHRKYLLGAAAAAREIAKTIARMHIQFLESAGKNFRPVTATAEDLQRWSEAPLVNVTAVLPVLRERCEDIPDGALAVLVEKLERLAARFSPSATEIKEGGIEEGVLERAVRIFREQGQGLQKAQIHGDLHTAQGLIAAQPGGRLMESFLAAIERGDMCEIEDTARQLSERVRWVDFEGVPAKNPVAAGSEDGRDSLFLDMAGVAQAFCYIAHIRLYQQLGLDPQVRAEDREKARRASLALAGQLTADEAAVPGLTAALIGLLNGWLDEVTSAFLDGYLDEAEPRGLGWGTLALWNREKTEALIYFWILARAAHELRYETYARDWGWEAIPGGRILQILWNSLV